VRDINNTANGWLTAAVMVHVFRIGLGLIFVFNFTF